VVYRDKIVEVPVDRLVTVEKQVQSRTLLRCARTGTQVLGRMFRPGREGGMQGGRKEGRERREGREGGRKR